MNAFDPGLLSQKTEKVQSECAQQLEAFRYDLGRVAKEFRKQNKYIRRKQRTLDRYRARNEHKPNKTYDLGVRTAEDITYLCPEAVSPNFNEEFVKSDKGKSQPKKRAARPTKQKDDMTLVVEKKSREGADLRAAMFVNTGSTLGDLKVQIESELSVQRAQVKFFQRELTQDAKKVVDYGICENDVIQVVDLVEEEEFAKRPVKKKIIPDEDKQKTPQYRESFTFGRKLYSKETGFEPTEILCDDNGRFIKKKRTED